MKKMFKRPIAIFMAVCMLLSLATVAGAADYRSSADIEIVFDGDIDKEKAQLIIDTINGEETVTTRGIACIFGHSIAQSSMRVDTHCVYAVSPRCTRETYKVLYCTRSSCDYISFTLIGAIRIYCCP